jgi:hypothetical protein
MIMLATTAMERAVTVGNLLEISTSPINEVSAKAPDITGQNMTQK